MLLDEGHKVRTAAATGCTTSEVTRTVPLHMDVQAGLCGSAGWPPHCALTTSQKYLAHPGPPKKKWVPKLCQEFLIFFLQQNFYGTYSPQPRHPVSLKIGPQIKIQITSPHLTSPTLTYPHLTSPHLPSSHLTSPHLTSPHLTSPHLTSPHLTSPHLTSPHLTYPHLTDPHLTSPHLTS